MNATGSSLQLPISDKCLQRIPGDEAAVSAALQQPISGGSEVIAEYEADLAKVFGVTQAIAVSSGGAALIAALYAAGVRPGDEVVLPPTCPLCTVYPIMFLGATPVFCDTYADGFGIDLEDLARVVTPKTRAVIDVPMWGYPTPVDRLRDATRTLGVSLVLDLAHSHGAKLDGQDLSAYGDFSCYSTHERKIISTGEGGFILAHDERLVVAESDVAPVGHGLCFVDPGAALAEDLDRRVQVREHLQVLRGRPAVDLEVEVRVAELGHARAELTRFGDLDLGRGPHHALGAPLRFGDRRLERGPRGLRRGAQQRKRAQHASGERRREARCRVGLHSITIP